VAPPSCSIVPEPSEVVCNPHAASFDLPDANETVCNPHTISFGLPDANEQCATHTPLRSSVFIPPIIWGGFFLATARMRRCEIDMLSHSSWIIPPNDRGNSLLMMMGRC